MRLLVRKAFPYLAAGLLMAAVAYAVSLGTLEPADFVFINGTEIQSVDPAIVTGVPEGRIINALFEGLYRNDPRTCLPVPAIAERYELSGENKVYTFHLRRDCRWSDGSPLTADDFLWSWRRFLHPGTAAQYAYQLYYVKNARRYNAGLSDPGEPVEVELDDQPPHPSGRSQLFPRGTLLHGKLIGIERPPPPADMEEIDKVAAWKKRWVYEIEIDGRRRQFARGDVEGAEKCRQLLLDFSQVGVEVLDDYTLRVTLESPTPFFLQLMAFYPLHPVNRACIERHGSPDWTKPENIVTSGPYLLAERRIRDRIRLVKNPVYWDAPNVQLETIDALAVNSQTTMLNLYMGGQADWTTDVPYAVIPKLRKRDDFRSAPMLTTYFYRLNVTRPPLDDVRIRRALNLTIDKAEICETILRAGQVPARALVPPGLPEFRGAECGAFDVDEARRLLAEAGHPGGRGLPTVEILFNTHEAHRTIAEKIQSDWKKHLGIDVELRNQEWGVYLGTVRTMSYQVARAAWVGDYADPNTFLDMFVTDGENNETGWSNARYDELIAEAGRQTEPAERMETLQEAERILMDELPIIPIYFYVSINMVRPFVEGFHSNIQDIHPLHRLRIDPRERDQFLRVEGLR